MKIGLLGLGVGFVIVFAGRASVAAPAPTPPPVAPVAAAPRAARTQVLSAAPCPQVAGGDDLATLRRDIDDLNVEIASREASLAPWIGEPRDFPEDFDPRAGPERADIADVQWEATE